MRFDVVTLFPELFAPHLAHGVTRRAFESGQVDVRLWPLRGFAAADDPYHRVDDRPYGGGPGMLLLAEPIERAIAAIGADRGAAPAIVAFTPAGRRLDQALVREFAAADGALLLCGRYEGIDERVVERHPTLELSLGDFVLSGGELPALALLDAVARLVPGVLNDAQSHRLDSFEDGLLEGPQYSRPEVFEGRSVPPVLLSGHHGEIARWRRERALERTARRRPDLIAAARATGRLSRDDERFLASLTL